MFLACCVASGFCDELIIRSEESYRLCVCLIVCDVDNTTMRRARHKFGRCATEQVLNVCSLLCRILQVTGLKFLARQLDASLRFFVLCIDPYEKFRGGI